ncbi:hypothetical protein ACIBF6_14805 [Streptosporangium amethystogenes]|uniref:hypothetical protein n=1 Tax=Streptosporangium amethystogenes TaxID=2002 RepID=UPI0037BC7F8C
MLQDAGLPDDDIDSAELIVAELAANAEKHAHPPYEPRIYHLDGAPTWCEIGEAPARADGAHPRVRLSPTTQPALPQAWLLAGHSRPRRTPLPLTSTRSGDGSASPIRPGQRSGTPLCVGSAKNMTS